MRSRLRPRGRNLYWRRGRRFGAGECPARHRRSNGLVWRSAVRVDPGVLRERWEADVGRSVVVVFEAVGRGTAKVVYGLTRGESSAAVVSRRFTVRVR